MKRYLFSAYAASGVCFLGSLLRDWVVVTQTVYAKEFFDLLYIASLFSGFVINAVTLGSQAPTFAFVGWTSGSSVLAMLIVGYGFYGKTLSFLILSATIVLLWVSGAIASRVSIVRGEFFFGRVREGVASFVMAALFLWGVDMPAGIILGVCAGTLWAFWASKGGVRDYIASGARKRNLVLQLGILLASNLASMGVFFWALYFNQYPGKLLGIDASLAVRISVYVFQIFSIGAVITVFRVPVLFGAFGNFGLSLSLICLMLALFASLASPSFAIMAMPPLAIVAHYAGVVWINRSRPGDHEV